MISAFSKLRNSVFALILLSGIASGASALARDSAQTAEALPSVSRAELPAQARATEQLIRVGGPFPFAKDGSVFGNRERILPPKNRGYYREYTVRTPGERHRGGRRIVCGGTVVVKPDACYYTDDHYASFRLIAQ